MKILMSAKFYSSCLAAVDFEHFFQTTCCRSWALFLSHLFIGTSGATIQKILKKIHFFAKGECEYYIKFVVYINQKKGEI